MKPPAGRHRRDFYLDAGGVTALASDRNLLDAYSQLFDTWYEGAMLIPVPVLTEVRSGYRRYDVAVDRLVKAIGAEEEMYAPLTVVAASRAGVLRTEAIGVSGRDISATDAQVVAMAEERSGVCAVTIVTGDPDDIELLVQLTHRPNIAVDAV